MKRITVASIIMMLTLSCTNEVKLARLASTQTLKPGEWHNITDSTFGLSIRENKAAFFEKMKFTSDDIFEYSIIDSFSKSGNTETKLGEYLRFTDSADTLYFKILEKNDSILNVLIENRAQKFKLMKRLVFREK